MTTSLRFPKLLAEAGVITSDGIIDLNVWLYKDFLDINCGKGSQLGDVVEEKEARNMAEKQKKDLNEELEVEVQVIEGG